MMVRCETAALPAWAVVVDIILIGIAVIAAMLGSRALAADREGAPPPGSFSNWSGPYIGVGITARYNAVDANVRAASVGTPAMPIPLPSVSEASSNSLTFWSAGPGAHQFIDNIAMGARVYGGWNFEVGRHTSSVLREISLMRTSLQFSTEAPIPLISFLVLHAMPFGASPDDEFKVKTTWDASARLRAGWLPNPSMLLYVTAGLAWAHLEVTSTCSTVATFKCFKLRPR